MKSPISNRTVLVCLASLFASLPSFSSDSVTGSASRNVGPSNAFEKAALIAQTKTAAVADAEKKCGSKVKLLNPFEVKTSSGQYGTYLQIDVTAPFACISDSVNRLALSSEMGAVRHMVFFRYQADIRADQRRAIVDRFLGLREKCLKDGKPYIVSLDAGAANSLEQADQGMNDGFLVTFKSVEDRDYYVGKTAGNPNPAKFDPTHDQFKNDLGASKLLDASQPNPVFVFDFTAQ